MFSFTPGDVLKSKAIRLTLPELFQNKQEQREWEDLRENVRELQTTRNDLLKEQRNVRLGLQKEHFLLGKYVDLTFCRGSDDV